MNDPTNTQDFPEVVSTRWLASLRRLRRLTVRRPGGGRLDEYSRGYDQAMANFAAAIRKEVDAANNEVTNARPERAQTKGIK